MAAEAAFGRFIIAWNMLEREIDRAIEDLYELECDLAWSVTANLGTKAKLDIFQSAFHCLKEFFSGELPGCPAETLPAETADKLVSDTAGASGEMRTFLIHGHPMKLHPSVDPNAAVEMWDVWIKMRGRKGGVRGPMFRYGEQLPNEYTATVRGLIDRWHAIRQAMLPCRKFRKSWESW
jgi:hypothetical protein